VRGQGKAESRYEALHAATALTPLVGRKEEIEILLRRWQRAQNAEGQVVLVSGEPGVGKSRLVATLQERLQTEPHIRLRYFCSPLHANSAFFPFVDQLERAARFERGDPPAEKYDKLESVLAQSAKDVRLATALLANMLSLPEDGRYPLTELNPQKRKESILEVLLAQMAGLAEKQPVLVVFEDVQWIYPTSLELLALTVDRISRLRVLLVITARPEFTPPWPGYAHVTSIALSRLSRFEGAALIEHVTAGKSLPQEVMDQILARTDGVPLFVEELTKTVLEAGLLAETDDGYVLEGRCRR
jgi:predicted ATPase